MSQNSGGPLGSMVLKLESISEPPNAVILRLLYSPESPEGLLNTDCWAPSPESVIERENLYLSEALMYS